jgi:excisionase family DNA binding protein
MTTIQASFYYGKSVSTIYKWIKMGKLVATKVGRVWVIEGLAQVKKEEVKLAKVTLKDGKATWTNSVGWVYRFRVWEKYGKKRLYVSCEEIQSRSEGYVVMVEDGEVSSSKNRGLGHTLKNMELTEQDLLDIEF